MIKQKLFDFNLMERTEDEVTSRDEDRPQSLWAPAYRQAGAVP